MQLYDKDLLSMQEVRELVGAAKKAQQELAGMTQEQVEHLFQAADHTSSGRGSGIGVKNVNERIKLYFGTGYGLDIQSEPDEGTTVTAHLPAIPYQEVKKEEAYVK